MLDLHLSIPYLPILQRRFNDQITGHSGLTFFEALKSEVCTPNLNSNDLDLHVCLACGWQRSRSFISRGIERSYTA